MTTSTPVKTTCPYCGVGCGVEATRLPDGAIRIAGDTSHPANLGRLCVKGSALGDTVGLDERLLYPQLRRGRRAGARVLGGRAGQGRGRPARHHR